MKKTKSVKIEFDKLIEKNPNIDAKEVSNVLKLLIELEKQGVNTGSRYNLASPFSRPEIHKGKEPIGSTLHVK
jgi:hypothetical protein